MLLEILLSFFFPIDLLLGFGGFLSFELLYSTDSTVSEYLISLTAALSFLYSRLSVGIGASSAGGEFKLKSLFGRWDNLTETN